MDLHWEFVNQLITFFYTDLIGYEMSEIRIFEAQHRTPEDPSDALLRDWGGRSKSATLEKLYQYLYQMGRHDMLTDMRQRWNIVK